MHYSLRIVYFSAISGHINEYPRMYCYTWSSLSGHEDGYRIYGVCPVVLAQARSPTVTSYSQCTMTISSSKRPGLRSTSARVEVIMLSSACSRKRKLIKQKMKRRKLRKKCPWRRPSMRSPMSLRRKAQCGGAHSRICTMILQKSRRVLDILILRNERLPCCALHP